MKLFHGERLPDHNDHLYSVGTRHAVSLPGADSPCVSVRFASVQNSVYIAFHEKEHTMSVITMPVTEAKQRFTEIVKGAQEYFDRYLVTRNGKEAAVVMSAQEYENLLETLDVLANKNEVRAIRQGSDQARSGETVSLDEYLRKKQTSRKNRTRR